MKLFEDEKFYGEINLKFDSTKKGRETTTNSKRR